MNQLVTPRGWICLVSKQLSRQGWTKQKFSFSGKTKKSNFGGSKKGKVPALLTPTASPFVFVARTALDSSIDPFTLFSEGKVVPQLFLEGNFEYCSPKALSHDFPQNGVPEVAFLGRSNVGKSSLINSIMRRNLCITSKSPGRTQQPYYYGLFPKTNTGAKNSPTDATGFILDLPGYGYGAAPKEIVEAWQEDTQNLLINRRNSGVLRRLFLLIDARRNGPTEFDRTVIRWLEDADIPYSIVLTKIDQASKPQMIKLVNELCMRYASQVALEGEDCLVSPVVHTTSSKRSWGVHELMLSVESEFHGYEDD